VCAWATETRWKRLKHSLCEVCRDQLFAAAAPDAFPAIAPCTEPQFARELVHTASTYIQLTALFCWTQRERESPITALNRVCREGAWLHTRTPTTQPIKICGVSMYINVLLEFLGLGSRWALGVWLISFFVLSNETCRLSLATYVNWCFACLVFLKVTWVAVCFIGAWHFNAKQPLIHQQRTLKKVLILLFQSRPLKSLAQLSCQW